MGRRFYDLKPLTDDDRLLATREDWTLYNRVSRNGHDWKNVLLVSECPVSIVVRERKRKNRDEWEEKRVMMQRFHLGWSTSERRLARSTQSAALEARYPAITAWVRQACETCFAQQQQQPHASHATPSSASADAAATAPA